VEDVERVLGIQRRVDEEQRVADEESAEERDAEECGGAGGDERGDQVETDEVPCAPLLFKRAAHDVEQQQREEERDRRRADEKKTAALQVLIREEAPDLAAHHRRAIERKRAYVARHALKLHHEERDVTTQEDVDGKQ